MSKIVTYTIAKGGSGRSPDVKLQWGVCRHTYDTLITAGFNPDGFFVYEDMPDDQILPFGPIKTSDNPKPPR